MDAEHLTNLAHAAIRGMTEAAHPRELTDAEAAEAALYVLAIIGRDLPHWPGTIHWSLRKPFKQALNNVRDMENVTQMPGVAVRNY